MFKFLKDKLKGAFSKFTKKVEAAPEELVISPEEKPIEKIEEPTVEPQKILEPEPPQPAPLPIKEKPLPKKAKEIFSQPRSEPKKETALTKEVEDWLKDREEEKKQEELKQAEPVIYKKKSSQETPKKTEPLEPTPKKIPLPEPQEQPLIPPDEPTIPEPTPEKKGLFGRITQALVTKKITEEQFNDLFWEVELAMLENNVAIDVIEKIKNDLRTNVLDKPLPRNKINDVVMHTLHQSLEQLFVEPLDLEQLTKEHKPLIIAFIGINGSGKTTSIAKVAYALQQKGHSIVMAAADTFRAAAIDQLQLHADKLGCKLIKHDYGADAAAVAYDAIEHAKAKKKDVVLIDTAGRLHSNTNLIDELKKILRVSKPHLKLFVGESITGNDCIEQAKTFNNSVGIDGIILSKADVDEKGGAALSISYVTKKPLLYLGVGQEYADLQKFDKEKLLAQIGI